MFIKNMRTIIGEKMCAHFNSSQRLDLKSFIYIKEEECYVSILYFFNIILYISLFLFVFGFMQVNETSGFLLIGMWAYKQIKSCLVLFKRKKILNK